MKPDEANQSKQPSMDSVELTGLPLCQDKDPRIKSPDDILSKLSPRKSTLNIPVKAADRANEIARQLAELRTRYDQEITQWREYARRIQQWRAQVVVIVEGLRHAAASQPAMTKELEQCRAALKNQEQELQKLRQKTNILRVVG